MKQILPVVVFTCLIIFGVALLVFVVSSFKIHANSMGSQMEIMMGKEMMYSHLKTWLKQMFWVTLIIIGLVIIISLIKKN